MNPEAFAEALAAPAAAGRSVLGFDLTFSAPKSVSILFGIGEVEVSARVRSCHDEAVCQALGYLEREACWTRRGAGGKQLLRGEGFEVALFRHRTTRAGDPQLHTHAVVVNATAAEGRSTALDGRALYAHAKTAGYLYEAVLRDELSRVLGLRWGPVRNGIADVVGVPDEVVRHFSQRRAQILERMAEMGGRSARSAQIATLETRRSKQPDVDLGELRAGWRARAAEHGLTTGHVAELLGRHHAPRRPDVEAVAERLTSSDGLTRQSSSFDRRTVLQAFAEIHPDGAPIVELERLADGFLSSERTVPLEPAGERPQLSGPRHSTPELLQLERELLDSAQQRQATQLAKVAAPDAEALSDEQRQVVEELTGSATAFRSCVRPRGRARRTPCRPRAWRGRTPACASSAARCPQTGREYQGPHNSREYHREYQRTLTGERKPFQRHPGFPRTSRS